MIEEIRTNLEIKLNRDLNNKEDIIREEKYSWNGNYMDSLGVLSDCMARVLADKETGVVAIYLKVEKNEAKYDLKQISLVKKNNGNDDTIKTNIKNLLKYCCQSESFNCENDNFLNQKIKKNIINNIIKNNGSDEAKKKIRGDQNICDQDFLLEIKYFFENILNNVQIQNSSLADKKKIRSLIITFFDVTS
jgi:hypothetical protein